MFKILASLMIIGSGSALGYFASLKFSFRIKELRELQESMNFMKNEVLLFNTTVHEIFRKLATKNNFRISIVFKNVINELEKDPYMTLENAWNFGVWESLKEISLKLEDLEVIKSVGLILEKSDIENQLKHMDYLYGRLEFQERKALENKNKNEKLVKIGGLLGGTALVILLF
jgi:stage III sporulation protein AB